MKMLSALLVAAMVLVAGCADQSSQSMSQDHSGYQSGHSSKLGQ